MNSCLIRAWGIGFLFAVLLPGCASLAPQRVTGSGEAPAADAFVNPLPGSRVVSSFGPRGRRNHEGVDLRKSTAGGEVVVAARAGTVETARRCRGYGLTVVIRHPDGSRTRYAHLKKILVDERQQVAAGRKIGIVGATGRATGPHLHFEVLTALGRCVNPLPYLQTVAVTHGDRLARRAVPAAPRPADTKEGVLPEEVRSNKEFCAWYGKWKNVDPSFSANRFEKMTSAAEDEDLAESSGTINAEELRDAAKAFDGYFGADREGELKIYSPDGTKFLWNAKYPDPAEINRDVVLFDTTAGNYRRLLDFGAAAWAEKVFWINDSEFLVIAVGESTDEQEPDESRCYYRHKLYLYDLEKNIVTGYCSPKLLTGDKIGQFNK